MPRRFAGAFLAPILLLTWGCPAPAPETGSGEPAGAAPARDPHSFARPEQVSVEHLDLDLSVDFGRRILSGRAALRLRNRGGAGTLVLDTRGLQIGRVLLGDEGPEAAFELGDEVPWLGRTLEIRIAPDTERVIVEYATDPGAEALQWLAPEQTAGGRHPFLYTQSQAILARTWVPCQDTPAVRFTYEATVRTEPELMALMSAENPTGRSADGVYLFRMPQPIPSYLLALAVGDLEFRPLGPRSGVYAEPEVVERAAWELAEVEAMMEAGERLYGPYRWGRYDLLVLPPSFPFGGMENPRLTFATPTILAGDRSLVALVAHELAHSWSGNLVTNATWNDFWLNEGFTSYLENRIMEEIKGPEYAEMLRSLSLQDLRDEIEEIGPESPDTHLELDLAGRNADDGMTAVPYDKGAAFLRLLEERAGRERWDAFLRGYFEAYAFRSLDSGEFLSYLGEHLLEELEAEGMAVDPEPWIHGPGIPDNVPLPRSQAFEQVEARIASWSEGAAADSLPTEEWTTHEWLHFLRNLPEPLETGRLAELDRAFGLSESGNSEILCAWLEVAIRNGYRAADPALESFLLRVGRRKFLKPLYTALAESPEGLTRARAIYERARPGYHAIAAATLDEILDWDGAG